MFISLDEVRHVARLARLELNDSEVVVLQGELDALIGHFGDIQKIDVGSIQPQSHIADLWNVWEDDRVVPGLARDAVLRNGALTKAGLFVVPSIIED